MNSKSVGIITIVLSICANLLWILGVIDENFLMFIASIILAVIGLLIIFKNYNEAEEFFTNIRGKKIEDERSLKIKEKAAIASQGSFLAILIYLVIGFVTLRSLNPVFLNSAYLLIAIIILQIVLLIIAKIFYKKKYGN